MVHFSKTIKNIEDILDKEKPGYLMVQGIQTQPLPDVLLLLFTTENFLWIKKKLK